MPLTWSERSSVQCGESTHYRTLAVAPFSQNITCAWRGSKRCSLTLSGRSASNTCRLVRRRPRSLVPVHSTLSPYQESTRAISSYSGGGRPEVASTSSLATKPRWNSTRDDLMELQLKQGCLVSSSGSLVIEGVASSAFVDTPHSKNGALVLGFNSEQGPVSICDINVGKLKFKRFLACARNKLWWMTPEWRTSTQNMPPETQYILLELEDDGPYAVLLPLIDDSFRATIRSIQSGRAKDGSFVLRVESGDDAVMKNSWNSLLYVAAGSDPYELIEQGVTTAASLSGGAAPLRSKQVPAILDLFGWCTWDAFYSSVSAKGIQEGLASLKSGGVHPGFLIIDDGWQLTDVDPPFGRPPTNQLADRMNVPKKEYLETTEGVFFQQAEEVLSETAKRMPESSTAGTVMRPLASMGPAPHHPQHTHSSMSSASSVSIMSQDPANAGSGSTYNSDQPGNMAPSGPTAPLLPQTDQEKQVFWLVKLGQKLAGLAIGAGTAVFLIVYQWVVEPSPPNSLANRFFAYLARGVLRHGMLSFYAAASDFTRRLISVRANGKFSSPDAGPDTDWDVPDRLGTVTGYIKEKFGIKFIYCWHGLPAYWAGVMPNALPMAELNARILYAKPTPGVLEVEPSMAWNPAVLAGIGVVEEPSQLYNAMHKYLHNAGIDGVKVDCQAGVGLAGSALGGGPALSRKYHAALEESVAHYFRGNHCINCMCHSTENLYRMQWTAVARASDDFYPRDPASSHPHLAACAFNSLFLSPLVVPDWDMFHSKHPAARLHASARAISGAGVYVSDKPGEHDFELLKSLVLPDGSVLRCRMAARPTRDTLFTDVLRDGRTCMKLWNVNAVVGVLGVFNIQGSCWDRDKRKFIIHNKNPPALEAEVRARDVEPFRALANSGAEFAVYSYSSGELAVMKGSAGMKVKLDNASAELYWVTAIMQEGEVRFAALGLTNMMNGGGAVMSCAATTLQPAALLSTSSVSSHMQTQDESSPAPHSSGGGSSAVGPGTPSFSVAVRGCGRLLLYSSVAPSFLRLNGAPCNMLSYDTNSGALEIDVPAVKGLKSMVQVTYAV